MKARLILFCSSLFFCTLAFGQSNAGKIFSATTAKYIISIAAIDQLFSTKKDQTRTLELQPGERIICKINMNVANDATTRTVGGILADYPDAFFTITVYQDKGKQMFTGSMISKSDRSAFKIYQQADGQICFERMPKDRIIVDN